jgi:excisionase family DNA binding protein
MTKPVTEGWVSTREAAELTGYTTAYMRQLANRKRIEAQKVGRDWLIERASLLAFKREMDALGDSKHNPQAPWRDDQDRGRGRG